MNKELESFYRDDKRKLLFEYSSSAPENPYTANYRGVGFVHRVKNSLSTQPSDDYLYSVTAKNIARGYVELLLTQEEFDAAEVRAFRQKNDVAHPKGFLQKILHGEFWRLF